MILFTVFQCYQGSMVAVEISAVTHVEVGPFSDTDPTEVCHIHAGPRRLVSVRATLDDVLDAIRNAS